MSSISDRDKKIMLVLGPVLVLGVVWFLLLAPKRAEVSKLGDEVATAQQERDTAVAGASKLQGSRRTYAKDYETVVRLGKAVPSSLHMPSLLVQLDAAAKGTGIDFQSIKAGERTTTAPAAGAAAPAGGSGQPPVAAGGEKAQSSAGQSTEKANNASAQSDQANSAANQQPAEGGQTTPNAGGASGGTTPPAGGAAGAPASGSTGVAGLDSVPLDFTFHGSYFDLADFFHRMKRFVRVANDDIKVRGRLMTIDNLNFSSTDFPSISATVKATVYLTPTSEGTTAGGTPSGPKGTSPTPAGSSAPPAGSDAPAAAPASSSSPAAGAQ